MASGKFYEDVYKFDEISKAYIIEVSLDDYNEIYDDWDPSPFKKRDIEGEFSDFIFDSSRDIPLKFGLKIYLYLPENVKSDMKEKSLTEAYRNSYSYKLSRLEKTKENHNKKIFTYLIFALLFLGLGYFYGGETDNIVVKILKEGVFIGGWVFLWEVFTLLFITKTEDLKDYKQHLRLLNAKLEFIYENSK